MNAPTTKSTYALLMESQSRKASACEDIIYGLMILCVVVSIFQFGIQTIMGAPVHKVSALRQAAVPQQNS
ncbi:MAG: hypothetical protein ABI839_03330 [Verrucomicrobiota bacterium]